MAGPAYISIADTYERRIRSGDLPPGTQLPSYAEIAEQNGVSDIVVRKVVELLRNRGLVRSVPRRGVFVSDHSTLAQASPERQAENAGTPARQARPGRAKPLHLQIAERIRADIEAGALRDGSALPSTRELATRWGVSVFTIAEAMQVLSGEGLVTSKSRSKRIVTAPQQASRGRAQPAQSDALITTATSRDEAERGARVALLPVGSFEQHGDYLPLATDTIVASVVTQELARAYPVLVLPPITISCSHEHARWRGTVSISARTLHKVVTDVATSLAASDVHRLVLISGHGGNYVLGNIAQEASVHEPRIAVFPQARDWDHARTEAGMETSSHEDMHAGELETSILLATNPEVVRPGNQTADWSADDRPHLLTLGMTAYTKSGVIGRPSLGTEAKGRAALASLVRSFDRLYALLSGPT
jgi:creatinine amidohydrolase